jgi:hypothetical protein
MAHVRSRVWRLGCLAVAALFVLLSAPVDAGGKPFNGFIAKSKKGTYRSSVIDIDQPDSNPQKYTKKIEPGGTATFFVKVKNAGPGDFVTAIFGDGDTADFDVSYFLNGEDVSDDYAGECLGTLIPAGGKVLFKMTINATGAIAGDTDSFAMVVGDDSSCFDAGAYDIVWGIVKVT